MAAIKSENNYFPRQCFYIKFEGDEKQISKGEKNSKNEEIKEKEEENSLFFFSWMSLKLLCFI